MSGMKSLNKLYVDDVRTPPISEGFIIVRDYDAFIKYILENGVPEYISFDHDLGDTSEDEKSGYTCAKWLVDYIIENGLPVPMVRCHSQNPVGKSNIENLFINLSKHYGK